MTARVVAGFPGVGKSALCLRSYMRVLDSDSSRFARDRFPDNYIEHIQSNLDRADLILVSTHQEVRSALVAAGIEFTLVYPTRAQRAAYLERYRRRGNAPEFVSMMDRMWDDFITGCERQGHCHHIVLRPGQYLSDVI